ncbi:MAG: hypothetical protein PHH60_00055 [Candidatus Margulisbacteria bacterium]|nr:hypothetical protein [Candidatus Margulisiibacteriota bacterium]
MSGLVLVGECYSGLLCLPGSRYRRITLATPQALKKFDNHPKLQQAVNEMTDPKTANPATFYMLGVVPQVFLGGRGQISIGMHLREHLDQEAALYDKARRALCSIAPGVHRLVLFKKNGVEASPDIASLPDDLYSAMLAKLNGEHRDPEFKNVVAVSVTDDPFDCIETREDGNAIKFSRSLLERAEFWAHIEEKVPE